MLSFPYPVLDFNESGYKDNIIFEIDESDCTFDHGQMKLKIDCKMNSDYLSELIDAGKAEIVFKITSNAVTKIYNFDMLKPVYLINHPTKELLDIDTIYITSYITLKEDLKIVWSPEFKAYFDEDYEFDAPAFVRLAVSNPIRLNYLLKNPDFIKITETPDMDGAGIKFGCNDPNYIRIYVGAEFNQAYVSNAQQDLNAKSLTNVILVSDALIYTIMQLIKEGTEHYSDNEWYRALAQASVFDEVSLDDFIAEMANDIQIDEVFRVVQEIMNNAIENTVIDISNRRK